jgi:cytochrome bd-type quinol oxidase subunit 2
MLPSFEKIFVNLKKFDVSTHCMNEELTEGLYVGKQLFVVVIISRIFILNVWKSFKKELLSNFELKFELKATCGIKYQPNLSYKKNIRIAIITIKNTNVSEITFTILDIFEVIVLPFKIIILDSRINSFLRQCKHL